MITAYTSFFNLTDTEVSTIGVIYFSIKAIGAFISCSLTKYLKGRILLINICCLIILTTNLSLSFILTKEMLYIERILSGLASGIIEPLMNNLLCEYLPIRLRGFTLLAVWTGFNLGQLYPYLFMMLIMPHFETKGIAKTLLLSSSLMFMCSVICLIYLKDSPRNYILHNQTEAGLKILEKLTPEKKISPIVKNNIVKELKEGADQNVEFYSGFDVFKNKFLLLTICVSVLSLISDLIYDGPVLITNITLTSLRANQKDNNVLLNAIVVILFTIPSSFIGGISLEIKFFGRVRTMFMSYLLLMITLVLGLIFTEYMHIFLGIYQSIANYCSIMAAIYASEVFPGNLRDFSVGLSLFFSNVGSALSQYVYIALHRNSTLMPYYFTIECCLVGCIFCCMLSVETYQMPLDSFGNYEKNISNLNLEKRSENNSDEEKVNLLKNSD